MFSPALSNFLNPTSTDPQPLPPPPRRANRTWVIVGASRGIGLEFVRQLLQRGDTVIAAVRHPSQAQELWRLAGSQSRPGACIIHQCDVTMETSIDAFVLRMKGIPGLIIDYLVLNAGILHYPNRATEISFLAFARHLSTNTIGPILTAQKLLNSTLIPIHTIVFMSSDSGSATAFREFEDGFGAYAASKAALNQMVRHMAAELKRKNDLTVLLCMHPGEVQTDLANIEVDWQVDGVISAEESVRGMLPVIESKTPAQSGTFWTWDGREHPW